MFTFGEHQTHNHGWREECCSLKQFENHCIRPLTNKLWFTNEILQILITPSLGFFQNPLPYCPLIHFLGDITKSAEQKKMTSGQDKTEWTNLIFSGWRIVHTGSSDILPLISLNFQPIKFHVRSNKYIKAWEKFKWQGLYIQPLLQPVTCATVRTKYDDDNDKTYRQWHKERWEWCNYTTPWKPGRFLSHSVPREHTNSNIYYYVIFKFRYSNIYISTYLEKTNSNIYYYAIF